MGRRIEGSRENSPIFLWVVSAIETYAIRSRCDAASAGEA
jgi:hypothetical protein